MLGGFIGGLIVAWILSWFHVDSMMFAVFQPLVTQVALTSAHYYMFFALIGLIGGAFKHKG